MIYRFQQFILEHQLFEPDDPVLLAVSGGIDSMIMWDLFERSGYPYAVIHCNFQLRGADSEGDEEMVRTVALKRNIRCFTRRFDTSDYARVNGISIEMAARELRYDWFDHVLAIHPFKYLATAHHRDDLLETFFINLVRKTGFKGLTGFREKTGKVIRPMLFTCRKEIEDWALENGIPYRKDITNDETTYQRNFIRHDIIPRLEKLNPAFRSNLAATMTNLRRAVDFYNTEMNRQIRKISVPHSENPEIFISQLIRLSHPRQVLYEWMKGYGFNSAVITTVFESLGKEPGRQFISATHRLIIDRNKLIITFKPEEDDRFIYLDEQDREVKEPVHLIIEKKGAGDFDIIRDPRVACLDAGKLVFPLIIRKWHPGEYFQPLGMTGFKKISDFFTDEKFSIPEKENTWILYSAGKVVWIIGHRIDNRFRITPETKEVLVIRMKEFTKP